MFHYQSSSDKPWNNAAPGVHPAKIGRIFMLLVFLLSLVAGSATSVRRPARSPLREKNCSASRKPPRSRSTSSRPRRSSITTSMGLRQVPTLDRPLTYGNWRPASMKSSSPGSAANTQYYYRMQYDAPGDAMNDWVDADRALLLDATSAGQHVYIHGDVRFSRHVQHGASQAMTNIVERSARFPCRSG